MDEVKFLGQIVGFKYMESTGTWRLEIDLFQKDKDQVPVHVKYIETTVDVCYSEHIDDDSHLNRLGSLLNDIELQTLLNTSGPEETQSAIESRANILFEDMDPEEIHNIITIIKKGTSND